MTKLRRIRRLLPDSTFVEVDVNELRTLVSIMDKYPYPRDDEVNPNAIPITDIDKLTESDLGERFFTVGAFFGAIFSNERYAPLRNRHGIIRIDDEVGLDNYVKLVNRLNRACLVRQEFINGSLSSSRRKELTDTNYGILRLLTVHNNLCDEGDDAVGWTRTISLPVIWKGVKLSALMFSNMTTMTTFQSLLKITLNFYFSKHKRFVEYDLLQNLFTPRNVTCYDPRGSRTRYGGGCNRVYQMLVPIPLLDYLQSILTNPKAYEELVAYAIATYTRELVPHDIDPTSVDPMGIDTVNKLMNLKLDIFYFGKQIRITSSHYDNGYNYMVFNPKLVIDRDLETPGDDSQPDYIVRVQEDVFLPMSIVYEESTKYRAITHDFITRIHSHNEYKYHSFFNGGTEDVRFVNYFKDPLITFKDN